MNVMWWILDILVVVPVGTCYALVAVSALMWRQKFGEPMGRERRRRLRAAFWRGFFLLGRWER